MDGRHVTRYHGGGEFGEFMAQVDDLERLARLSEREDRREERERIEAERAIERELDGLAARARRLAAGELNARGYRQHARGAWRLRRGGGAMLARATTTGGVPTIEVEAFRRDIDSWLCERYLDRTGPDDPEDRAALRREVVAYARDLAGPDAPAIERALADAAATCWYGMRHAEADAIENRGQPAAADFRLRKLEHATRRLALLLKTLAQVRRLAAPSIRVVNVGNNVQTNVVTR